MITRRSGGCNERVVSFTVTAQPVRRLQAASAFQFRGVALGALATAKVAMVGLAAAAAISIAPTSDGALIRRNFIRLLILASWQIGIQGRA